MKNKKFIIIVIVTAVILELIAIIALTAHRTIAEALFSAKNEYASEDIQSTPPGAEQTSSTPVEDTSEITEEDKPGLGKVPPSYFDDALFIGDSRTVGLRAFGGFSSSAFFAKTGISVNSLFTYPALDENTYLTLTQTLLQKKYGKIYIMIGVNDLAAAGIEEFSSEFFEAIEQIRGIQPDAVIYIQSILGVTKSKEASNPNYYSNSTVLARNALLKSKCNGEDLIYLDVFSTFSDEEGYLDSNHSADGLHLINDSYSLWYDYLTEHGITD